MNRRKLVEWAGLDTFLVCGNDLRLYRMGTGPVRFTPEAPPQPGQPTLIATAPDLQFPKCLAWLSPHAAAGLLNGKVVLTRFDGQTPPRVVKEFVPRHSRSCNALAWNPLQPTQLAAGLDKVRNDFSALVWDVEARGEARAATDTQQTVEAVTRASTELANSEATVALAWVPKMPSCLATGTGVKWLRIYDLRGDLNTPPSVVAHSKAVLGVLFDPFADQRFATFSDSTDGVVKLWDLRMLTDPVFALNTGSKALHQVEWSPTRPGVLATLSKDELGLKLWDLKESDKTSTLALNAPPRTHPSTEALSCIAWHPRLEQATLTVSNSGVVELSTLHVPLALSWGPHATLAFTYAKSVSAQPVSLSGDVDVSEAMRIRLAQGYSIDVSVNRTLGKQRLLPHPLRRVWAWMHRVSRLFSEQTPASAGATPLSPLLQSASALHKQDRYRGVHGLLSPVGTPSQSESGVGEVTIPGWRSPARALALQICGGGWGAPTKEALELRLQELERKGEHERAAALAVFHRDLRRAIEALQKGGEARSEQGLTMVGYVLAGYNEGAHGNLWRGRCRALAAKYEHPYLRAVFAFLTAEARDFRPLLDGALSLRDRVAFAVTFLPDSELVAFLDRLTSGVVKAGELEGILLTGLGGRGLDLLESYVDTTGDVQSASLLAQHAPARRASPQDERLMRWGEWYRLLLNRWQAWHERARLDIAYYRDVPDVEAKPPPQVFARCNYCNQSLSLGMVVPSKARAGKATGGFAGKQRVTSCPSCNKPLPRCALCLMHLACSIPSPGAQEAAGGTAPFAEWFTWCQTCRHGGHTKHILDWFRTHDVCPVTDCNCRCSAL